MIDWKDVFGDTLEIDFTDSSGRRDEHLPMPKPINIMYHPPTQKGDLLPFDDSHIIPEDLDHNGYWLGYNE